MADAPVHFDLVTQAGGQCFDQLGLKPIAYPVPNELITRDETQTGPIKFVELNG